MFKTNMKRVLMMAILVSIATLTFAEDAAPVYDADNFPPQFDSIPDSSSNGMASQDIDALPLQQPSSRQPISLDQRIARAEQQINSLQRIDASAKISTLQSEVQTLRGQVEELTHQLQQIQNQQRIALADLDKRVGQQTNSTKVSTDSSNDITSNSSNEIQALREQVDLLKKQLAQVQKSQTVTTSLVNSDVINPSTQKGVSSALRKGKSKILNQTPTPDDSIAVKSKTSDDTVLGAEQPNVAEEQQIYQTAYDLIKAKKYNDAIAALQKMLKKYPTGQFAANAHYWLGELYNLLGKNDQSATEFGSVVRSFPDSPKVADAQLKLGLIYVSQFKWSEAKSAFKKVINNYPGTSSSRLAAEQIKQIKQAGH